MLRDIPNPFHQIVTRGRRPSHPGLGGSAAGTVPGRVIIPVRVPPNHDDAAGPFASGQHGENRLLSARVTVGPGPGDVAVPKWWQNHGAGPRPTADGGGSSAGDNGSIDTPS